MIVFGNVQISWREVLDFGLVTFLYYRLIMLIKGTRAVPILYGLVLLAVLYYASKSLGLGTLHWLLGNFLGSIFIVIIILFQTDIRKGLAAVGAGHLWKAQAISENELNHLVWALTTLAQSRIGALVVIERSVPLGDIIERSIVVDARISRELLTTIFFPDTALHDGAVILQGDRIAAAGCILPLSPSLGIDSEYGTRHRAAIGITEETDALAIAVSEERGEISVAEGGQLTAGIDEVRLRRRIRSAWEKR